MNSCSLSINTFNLICWNLLGKKTLYGKKRPFWSKRGLFWGSKSKILSKKEPYRLKNAFLKDKKRKNCTFLSEFLFSVKIPFIWYAGIYVLEKKQLLAKKRSFRPKKKTLFGGSKRKLQHILLWIPILCQSTFHLICWNLLEKKKQFMVIKGLFGQKGAFFGVRKAKNLKFFGKFLFSVKIPFIWYAGIYIHEKRYFG